jgi:thienamycin biosynthesis protein ThnO
VVVTSEGDPVVSCLAAAALLGAGLPPGAVSVCHGPAPTVWQGADQLVWPGEDVPGGLRPDRVKTYHFGRSKAIMTTPAVSPEVWRRLTRLAFEGSGRLCTNPNTLAVVGDRADALAAARELADGFAAIPVLDLDDRAARVPAWPDVAAAESVAAAIDREVAGGGVDITREVGGGALLTSRGGHAFLRPTVLLTEVDSPLFGTELALPFVAVAPVAREHLVEAMRESLIVSILDGVGGDAGLFEELADEPTIGKVFAGSFFDRGYEATDSQEGFLADFLFQKKPLLGDDAVESTR